MGSTAFALLAGENHRFVSETLADYSRVQTAGAVQQKLRGVPEAIGGEPCFQEDVTFDIGGHGFRIPLWLLGLAVVIQIIRPKALQRHVWPPSVVPAFELGAEERQVVKTFDERDVFQPLILEGLDDAFCHSNRPVLPYGSEAGFDVPLSQQLGKDIPYEYTGLV